MHPITITAGPGALRLGTKMAAVVAASTVRKTLVTRSHFRTNKVAPWSRALLSTTPARQVENQVYTPYVYLNASQKNIHNEP